jgi:hypothetical protein
VQSQDGGGGNNNYGHQMNIRIEEELGSPLDSYSYDQSF